MKSIILCEGLTDCIFLQYYMRNVYNWKDAGEQSLAFTKWNRKLKNEVNQLIIGHNGGCNGLIPMLDSVFKSNYLGQENELYCKVVFITDRDEYDSEVNMINQIQDIITSHNGFIKSYLKNNEWVDIDFVNSFGQNITVSFLILVIPLEECGAIETVLLNSVAEKDSYDKKIIDDSKKFVDDADSEGRYLSKRRYKLKAWFNIFFSIRVPEDFYVERQRIFMKFPWKESQRLNHIFQKLDYLSK